MSNDRVAQVRRISHTAEGEAIHLDGETMGAVLDQYGSAVSAEFTNMRALDISYYMRALDISYYMRALDISYYMRALDISYYMRALDISY